MRDGPVEATPELDQAPDNDMRLELMSMCEEMNIWQRFPRITAHFLQEFDRGEMSETEMAKEIYLLVLEAERDENISEEELIRTTYMPPAGGENGQGTTGGIPEATQRFNEEMPATQDTAPILSEREEPKRQEMTKEKIMELVEEGTMSAEQGREEYEKLEEGTTSSHNATSVTLDITRAPISETETIPKRAAPKPGNQRPQYRQEQDRKTTEVDYDKDPTTDHTENRAPNTVDGDRYYDINADNEGDTLPSKHNSKKEITSDKDIEAGMPIMTPSVPSPTGRDTCGETNGDTKDGTISDSDRDTHDKEKNIPGRNVGLGAPSSIPHQLHHVKSDTDHKDTHDNTNHGITHEPDYDNTPETKQLETTQITPTLPPRTRTH